MNDVLDKLREEIVLIVERTVEKYMKENKYEKPYDGTITKVDSTNKTYEVDLGFATLSSVKNKSGESLAVNDCVTVYAKGGNINNAYIGLKF